MTDWFGPNPKIPNKEDVERSQQYARAPGLHEAQSTEDSRGDQSDRELSKRETKQPVAGKTNKYMY